MQSAKSSISKFRILKIAWRKKQMKSFIYRNRYKAFKFLWNRKIQQQKSIGQHFKMSSKKEQDRSKTIFRRESLNWNKFWNKKIKSMKPFKKNILSFKRNIMKEKVDMNVNLLSMRHYLWNGNHLLKNSLNKKEKMRNKSLWKAKQLKTWKKVLDNLKELVGN